MTRERLRSIVLECLERILTPIVSLALYCGLGHTEFSGVVKRVFIDVATKKYGVRGRPANASRVAAVTGLPRKVVSRYRSDVSRPGWSPDEETNPINTIIHYWRYDEHFSIAPGVPRELTSEGPHSFLELVKRYAGDIPPSTIRQELIRDGIAELSTSGMMKLIRDYSFPEALDEDFMRNAAFSIANLASTILHNAQLVEAGGTSEEVHREAGRFERIAWSRRLAPAELVQFRLWVRDEGASFLQRADELIAQLESQGSKGPAEIDQVISGVGIYFFEDQ